MNTHFPSNQPRERCKSCRAPIMWAETEKGRRIPIDPEPVSDGNIVLHLRGNFMLPLALVRFSVPTHVETRYKSHFATCPNAARHRKQ